MHRYRYECEDCKEEFIALHSISDVKETCDICGHKGIKKLLGKPVIIRKNTNVSTATGDLTNEYIEANKELLKDMKEEAKNELYE